MHWESQGKFTFLLRFIGQCQKLEFRDEEEIQNPSIFIVVPDFGLLGFLGAFSSYQITGTASQPAIASFRAEPVFDQS